MSRRFQSKLPKLTKVKITDQLPALALTLLMGAAGGYWAARAKDSLPTAEHGARLVSEGRYSEAISALSAVLRADPRDASSRLALAQAYLGLGWLTEARSQLELSSRSAKETLRGCFLTLSEAEAKSGNTIEAKKLSGAATALGAMPL